MQPIIDIPWIKSLITVSLGLGLTGFLLSLGNAALSRSGSSSDKSSKRGVSSLVEFFDGVLKAFEVIVTFIYNVVDATITAATMIGQAMTVPFELVGFLPGVVGSCVLVTVAIGVAKFLLGR